MTQTQTNLLQGTLDMMILKSLALDQMHGLGISRRIEQITKGTFQVKPGSLFPALHRMEEEGCFAPPWGNTKKNPPQKISGLRKLARDSFKRRPNAGAVIRRPSPAPWKPLK